MTASEIGEDISHNIRTIRAVPLHLTDGKRKVPTFLGRWSNAEIATSAEEGKIPRWDHWARQLANRSIS